jgi:hypothetical protein
MAPETRRQLLLAALAVVLAVLIYRGWSRSPATDPAAAGGAGARRPAAARAEDKAPDVHLEALDAERPAPEDVSRNLFTFGRPVAPTPEDRPAAGPLPAPRPAAPTAAGAPPIPLKFIGVMTVPGQAKKVAILRDDRGVYHGAEGEIIEGRYKILRIGEESIEMSYLDDSGRQTIRLSGS